LLCQTAGSDITVGVNKEYNPFLALSARSQEFTEIPLHGFLGAGVVSVFPEVFPVLGTHGSEFGAGGGVGIVGCNDAGAKVVPTFEEHPAPSSQSCCLLIFVDQAACHFAKGDHDIAALLEAVVSVSSNVMPVVGGLASDCGFRAEELLGCAVLW